MKNDNNLEPKHTNRLVNELSPYLLQHAYNPVNWYPWSTEALDKAKQEDKPILISIGYAACHWCHVMERESFENEEVASYMNEHFVNIKVDREERPDLDNIYMEALTIISGSGGWPLNCFLLPDGRPFYGGTYYPPNPGYGKPDWLSLLKSIVRTFSEKRQEVEAQANQLTYHIMAQDKSVFESSLPEIEVDQLFEAGFAETLFVRFKQRFDKENGGFGAAPKFPGTMNLQWLLFYYHLTKDKTPLQHALFSLDKMCDGGIYDQLGGGFARYSVDNQWLVPHFEKMLYDNALLIDVLADAFKLTHHTKYKETIEETLEFIASEMTSLEGGFYSSYDADSEGVEGKYYVWDKAEIDSILNDESAVFNAFYGVTSNGNREGKNILNRRYTYKSFAEKTGYSVEQLKNLFRRCKRMLLAKRQERVKPALDDKIILGWNALMTTAYAKAFLATGNESFRDAALKNLEFLLEKFSDASNTPALFHTYKDGKAQYPAFLDDYAFLIEAILAVYAITFDEKLPQLANTYLKFVQDSFTDPNSHIFFYTPKFQTDVIVRKKEFYDSAIPSGNATMAVNLKQLGIILDQQEYVEQSAYMVKAIETSMLKYPTSFSRWAFAALQFISPSYEVAVIGPNAVNLALQIGKYYHPNIVVMATTDNNSPYSLLQNRFIEGKTLIYVCKNNSCQRPVETIEEALELMLE